MWHHHGSDMSTSARAILHHTDPKVPNIMDPSVYAPVVWNNYVRHGKLEKEPLFPEEENTFLSD